MAQNGTGAVGIYRRIILKITGEALKRKNSTQTINMHAVEGLAEEIISAYTIPDRMMEIAVVIGGGNIVRGREHQNIDRVVADQMGMLATVINALDLQEVLEKRGVSTRTQTAIEIKPFAEPYIRRKAIAHLEQKRIVIIAGGTGNPFCSTDDAAILRALELKAEAILKGTKVDGLYRHYPPKRVEKPIEEITYREAMELKTQDILDHAAIGRLMDAKAKIPIHIFNIFEKGNLQKILLGEKIGSKIY